jgi:branched-subunit amino acid transport protein
MTGLVPLLLLAAACWLVRVAFIVFLPADRLPVRVTAALGQVAPAVLAALVSVETFGAARIGDVIGGVASVACVAAVAAMAYRRPSLTVSAGLGLAAVLLIDVLLPRVG